MPPANANNCVTGVENQQRIIALESARKDDRDEHREMWNAIDKLRNRPPVWTTVVMTLMGMILGITGTLAVISGKLAGITSVFEWVKASFC